jgi:hypothetical protein
MWSSLVAVVVVVVIATVVVVVLVLVLVFELAKLLEWSYRPGCLV